MEETSTKAAPDIAAMEKEFEDRLRMFDREVDDANRSYYAYMAIHHEYATREAVRELCDSLGTFTKTILSSLQAALFLAFGRIFDGGRSKHTVRNLLQFAENHLELFSEASLRERKKRASSNWAEWLDGYMEGFEAPTAEQFRAIGKLLKPHRKMYAKNLIDVRNKWFAHREVDVHQANVLFGKTNVKETEVALTFLMAMHNALWDLYNNGASLRIDTADVTPNETRTHPADAQAVFVNQKLIRQETKEFLRKAAPDKPSVAVGQ